MRFKFDPNQEYQVEAVEAVTDLFTGQSPATVGFSLQAEYSLMLSSMPNCLTLDEDRLLVNLNDVQKRNGLKPDPELLSIEGTIPKREGDTVTRFPNFSVEMETGTGKTYVYLRTIHELAKRYGWSKYIVVVPTVAIREGVLKTLKITEDHFRTLYGNPVYRFYTYDSTNLTQVRQFALSDAIEVMVMTIDSFNKASNVIRQSTDRLLGETPIHLIQEAKPILILDEPQNMESEKSVAALAALQPLFALRYSATHRNPYNLVYRLAPAEAYRQGLVKKIEVDSVIQEDDVNLPYLRLDSIESQKTKVTARLTVHKLMKSGQVKLASVTVVPNDSLQAKTSRNEYAGFEVDEISILAGFIRFANNVELSRGQEIGSDKEAIFRAQIRQTVEHHFRKQEKLKEQGIKILSLFFIDRVANYAEEDGIIRRLFKQAFDELKTGFPEWKDMSAGEVQAAYFAQKRHKGGGTEFLESISGDTKDDEAAYDLIMKDKELLLSFPHEGDDPETRGKKQVCFIFSHSALREGWDNPNIFQICTLNQTLSPMKKRQEIGRGIRLAVDRNGDRVRDEKVNILTVIANESYRRYVESYQDEIAFEYRAEIEARYGKPIGELTDSERRLVEAEYGVGILPPPPRKAGEKRAKLRKARALSREFKELWDRIKPKTRYSVQIDTEKLLGEVIPAIDATTIAKPRVTITRAAVNLTDDCRFETMQVSGAKTLVSLAGRYPIPNLVTMMEDLMTHASPPVRLTRRTLLEVFRRASDKQAALDNPSEWCAVAVRVLKEKLADHLVHGIRYEKNGQWYDMNQILDEKEVELFSKYIQKTKDRCALYDVIPCDSEVEREFVQELEAREDVKLYLKLPSWFVVPTPIGDYNPDWAVVMDGATADRKPLLYLVAETKGSKSLDDLRPDERRKIQCGAAHFGSSRFKTRGALEGVDYRMVTSAAELPA
ncbi:MAG: DEAD/DEAH box helicase family protein [Desulfomonilaceae bacterium]